MQALPVLSQRITSRLKQLFDIRKVWSGEATPVIVANDRFSIPVRSAFITIEDTSTTKAIFSTRSDRNTYVQLAFISVQKANTNAVDNVTITGVQGGQTITLHRVNTLATASERISSAVTITTPILLDRGTAVTLVLNAASAAGNQYTAGVYFIEEEAIEAS